MKKCSNCERMVSSRQFAQHTKACLRMPNTEDFKSIVPTLSISAMARLWGVGKGAVRARLNRTGLVGKNDFLYATLTKEQYEQVLVLYQEDLSLKDIGRQLQISVHKVNNVVRRSIYHGEIVRRKKIYSKTAAKERRIAKHHCVKCEVKLDHILVLPGRGLLCGFCVEEILMDIQFLEPDGSTCYTKGHVDKQKFIEAMVLESGMSIEELDLKPGDIKHTLARMVPVPGGKEGHRAYGFDFFVYFDQEKKRGAFPATYVNL